MRKIFLLIFFFFFLNEEFTFATFDDGIYTVDKELVFNIDVKAGDKIEIDYQAASTYTTGYIRLKDKNGMVIFSHKPGHINRQTVNYTFTDDFEGFLVLVSGDKSIPNKIFEVRLNDLMIFDGKYYVHGIVNVDNKFLSVRTVSINNAQVAFDQSYIDPNLKIKFVVFKFGDKILESNGIDDLKLTELTANASYTLTAKIYFTNGQISNDLNLKFTTPPIDTEDIFSITDITAKKANLNIDRSKILSQGQYSKIRLYDSSSSLIGEINNDVTAYKIDNLLPNQNYTFFVDIVFDRLNTSKKVPLKFDTQSFKIDDIFKIVNITTKEATLNIDRSKILSQMPYEKIRILNSEGNLIRELDNTVRSYKISGLSPEKEYTYVVEIVGTTTEKTELTFKTVAANKDVENLKAIPEATQVFLSWKMPEYDELQFARIYRKKENSGIVAKMKSLFVSDDGYSPLFETNGTNFRDLTVAADTEYTYKVTTVDTNDAETSGVTIKTKTPKMSVSGGNTEVDENGDYIITWDSPTTGKIKVLIARKEYAIVSAADKKIIIPKEEMKFDLLGNPDVQLIPIDEEGNEGLPSKPGGGGNNSGGIGDIIGGGDAAEITPENTLDIAIGLFLLVGGFLLLGMSFWLVPKIIRLIRQAFDDKNGQPEIGTGRRTS